MRARAFAMLAVIAIAVLRAPGAHASGEVWRYPEPDPPCDAPSEVTFRPASGAKKGDPVPALDVSVHDQEGRPVPHLAVGIHGGSSGPAWLSPHPTHEKRVENGILWAKAYLRAEFDEVKKLVAALPPPKKGPAGQGQKSLQQLTSETSVWKQVVSKPE